LWFLALSNAPRNFPHVVVYGVKLVTLVYVSIMERAQAYCSSRYFVLTMRNEEKAHIITFTR